LPKSSLAGTVKIMTKIMAKTCHTLKKHEKRSKNTASKYNVFLLQHFKLIINVHLLGRDCHSVFAICLASSIEYHHSMKS